MFTGIALSIYFCLPNDIAEPLPQVAEIDVIEEEPVDNLFDDFFE